MDGEVPQAPDRPATDRPAPDRPAPRTIRFDDLAGDGRAGSPGPPPALGPRPRPADVRRRPAAPGGQSRDGDPPGAAVSPGRALAGAALSVCGVALGIVVLLWITDDPDREPTGDLGAASSSQQSRVGAATSPTPAALTSAAAPPPSSPPPSSSPPTSPMVTPAPAAAGPAVVPVTVLNNSRRSGLAARAAARFEQGGWPVSGTGNVRGRIPVTTVYYGPGLQDSAQAFADVFDGVLRVRPRFAGLPEGGLVVVVTREFPA